MVERVWNGKADCFLFLRLHTFFLIISVFLFLLLFHTLMVSSALFLPIPFSPSLSLTLLLVLSLIPDWIDVSHEDVSNGAPDRRRL